MKILAMIMASLMFAAQLNAAVLVGFGISSGAANCISGTYAFGWGGEWDSDTDRACAGSSDTTGINGTIVGSPEISTTYGESGSDLALRADANAESIKYDNTGSSIVDMNGAQTIWMRIYISATPSGDTRFFTAASSTPVDQIYVTVKSTREIVCTHKIGGTAVTAYGVAISAATWTDIAYSWDSPNGDHSANSSGSWEDDNNEITLTSTNPPDEFYVGTAGGFSMGVGGSIRITKFAVVSGYKASKPW